MRPIKQSNSMKELLKKLKRHDTLVLTSGIITASLLCGGFVYVTTPAISADAAQEEVRKDSLGVQKKASDQLKEIENYLERLDQVVTDSQELVKEVQTVQSEQKEITEKAIETQKTLETQKTTSLEKSTNNNSTHVVEKISGLDKELDSIHSEIKSTNSQVKELKDSMDKGGDKNSDKDKENFAQITNALSDIKKSCDKSGTDMSGLVAELKENKSSDNEKQKTVINNLETIVKSFEKVDTKENLSRMENDLKSTQTTYVNMLDNVEKSVAKTTDSVKKVGDKVSKVAENVNSMGNGISEVRKAQENADTKIGAIGSDIGNVKGEVGNVSTKIEKVEGLVGNVQGEINGVKTSLDDTNTKIDQLSGQVQQVFQCSDSNRKRLASILSEIGGFNAAEDATFEELIEAVKLIPAHVINSGKVSYEHHYHKDASGNIAKDRSTQKGGCFNTPVYHVHGDGCYVELTYYRFIPNWQSYPGNNSSLRNNHVITCPNCQEQVKEKDIETHTHRTSDLATVRQYKKYWEEKEKKLICKKDGSIIDYYVPNCGYTYGAIIKAVINYPKVLTNNTVNANTTLSTSMLSASEGLNINEEIFSFDVYQDEETHNEDNEPNQDGAGQGETEQTSDDETNEQQGGADENGEQNVVPEATEDTGNGQPEATEDTGNLQPEIVPAISDGNSEG